MDGAPEHDGAVGRRTWPLALAVFALALYPAVLGWLSYGNLSAFRFFAADAFYYLTIAKHDLPFPLYAFDGSHPVNGFHPLWQMFLNAAFANFAPLKADQAAQIAFTHWIGVLCVAVAGAVLALSAARLVRAPAIVLFCIVPGFLYLPVALIYPGVGAFWSFANGMESAFSLLIFAALLFTLLRRDFYARLQVGPTLAVSALAALMVLARLDDVFILAALSAPILFSRRPKAEIVRWLVLINLVPVAAIVGYLATNAILVGEILPVSGKVKSGFQLIWNLRQVANLFAPIDAVVHADWQTWRNIGVRTILIVAPALVSLVFAVRNNPFATGARTGGGVRVLVYLSAYVVLKAAYNLAFVKLWHQGHWYFPVSLVIASIQAACLLQTRLGPAPGGRSAGGVFDRSGVIAALAILYVGNTVLAASDGSSSGQLASDFWMRRGAIMQDLTRIDPAMKILSYDDGVVAYVLDVPVMSGFGFALDPEAAEAAASGRLLDVAHARGFRHMGSLNSLPLFDVAPGADVTADMVAGGWITAAEGARWRIEFVYLDPETRFKLLSFRPRTDR